MFRFFSLSILIISIMLIGCTTEPTKQRPKNEASTMLARYPTGYTDWSNTFSKVVLDKTSPFYGFQRVLVSKKALPTYKNGGQYPQGSQLVLEFSEPVMEGDHEKDDIVKGSVNWIAVMTKDPSTTKTGGWAYDAFDGNPNVAIKKDMDLTGCYDCHTTVKRKDYVFSSPK